MRVLILGGTGPTGLLLIRKALAAGHTITAYARNPSKLPEDISSHKSVTVVKGELTDEASLRHAIRDVETILSVLGPNSFSFHIPGTTPDTPLANAYSLIVRLMKEPGVTCKRIILLGTLSIPDPADKRSLATWSLIQAIKLIAYAAYWDIVSIGETFKKEGEGIEWTIVRVPMLTDAESEETVAGYVGDEKMGLSLSRIGYAAFCTNELTRREWVGKAPALSSS
ncbi:NAD-binding protein [Ceratobasidium sp. AG-I]|nr:NAD-binding protein [Ceratobasidium sp. AG-I]